jgi:methionyl-tRNA formyltransferase
VEVPLRIIFFGTAELACASLEALARVPEFQVVAVVTQPDKPRGRKMEVQPSAVKELALRLAIPILQPKRARDESFLAELRALAADLMVVVAYGQILPQALLDIPRHGCLNVHTSLLPKYRGAAPIQWAILNGDAETGVTIMKMDAGLDTGPILSQRNTPTALTDNSQILHDRLARMGAELLVETIPNYVAGKIAPVPQPPETSYARKIEKTDGNIDWSRPAETIERLIRAFTPWPSAFTFLETAGTRRMLKIWEAEILRESGPPGVALRADASGLIVACGVDALRIKRLQLEGGKRMNARDFLAGHPIQTGQVFTR